MAFPMIQVKSNAWIVSLTFLVALLLVISESRSLNLPICPPQHPHQTLQRVSWLRQAAAWGRLAAKKHVVVFDVGSTGTRVHLFPYTRQKLGDIESLNRSPGEPYFKIFPPLTRKVKPGLSAIALDYAADMARFERDVEHRRQRLTNQGAAQDEHHEDNALVYPDSLEDRVIDSLEPLLRFVRQQVAKSLWHITPILVSATGGVRLLNKSAQKELITIVQRYMEQSGLMFHRGWARVISGSQEGIFTWLAVVYAKGNLFGQYEKPLLLSDYDETTTTQTNSTTPRPPFAVAHRELEHDGVVELGGASLQLTYPIRVPTKIDSKNQDSADAMISESADPYSSILDTDVEGDNDVLLADKSVKLLSEVNPSSVSLLSDAPSQDLRATMTPSKFISFVRTETAATCLKKDPHNHIVSLMHQAPVHVFTTSYPVFGLKKAYESIISQMYPHFGKIPSAPSPLPEKKELNVVVVEKKVRTNTKVKKTLELFHPCLPTGQRTSAVVLKDDFHGNLTSQILHLRLVGSGKYHQCAILMQKFFDHHLGTNKVPISPENARVRKDIRAPPPGPMPYGETHFFASENFFHTRKYLIDWWDDLVATTQARLYQVSASQKSNETLNSSDSHMNLNQHLLSQDLMELTELVLDMNQSYADFKLQWPRYIDKAPIAAEPLQNFTRHAAYGTASSDKRRRLRTLRRSRRRLIRKELAFGVLRLRDLVSQRGLQSAFLAVQDLTKHGLRLPSTNASSTVGDNTESANAYELKKTEKLVLKVSPLTPIWKGLSPELSGDSQWSKTDLMAARDGNTLINILMTLGSLYCKHGVRHVSPSFYADLAPRRLAVHCFASAYIPVLLRRVLGAGFATRRKILIDQVVDGWPVEWPLGAAAHLLASQVLKFQQLVERQEHLNHFFFSTANITGSV